MNSFKYLKPKLFSVMKNYTKEQCLKDIIAGLIVAVIALPLSIALAIASGVNPEQGLYTAIIAGFFISFLGGSRVQIGGPTAAFVVIIYGIIAEHGIAGLTVATLMAGVMLILMGLFHFGDLIKFIPKTITIGFTLGIAMGIVVGQVKDFLGLSMGAVPAEFVGKLVAYGHNIKSISFVTLAIGLLAILIQIVWPKVSKKIPGSLIAILVTTFLVAIFKLPVKTIGDLYTIKAGLPSFTMPTISFSLIREMILPAFTIAILAAIESLLSAVVSDGMTGSKHKSNAELVAQGVGNFMSALLAGMVHAFTLLLILLFLMPYASYIPMSCLAAILIIVGYNMSGWRICVRMVKTAPKSDIAVLIITFLLTLFFDLVIAIEFGMVLAAFLFLKRMSDIAEVRQWTYKGSSDDDKLSEEVDLKYVPKNTVVYEIFGALFFGAANVFTNFEHGEGKNVLIIRMRNVPVMDISGLEVLEEILEICQKRGLTLILSHVNEQPYHVMEKAGFIEKIGKKNICENIDASLERAGKLAKTQGVWN